MKNYTVFADGSYVRERRKILKELGSWRKMTEAEKQPFNVCRQCTVYNHYIKCERTIPCPCETCEHRKTEIQVDNQMKRLRKKYFEGGI